MKTEKRKQKMLNLLSTLLPKDTIARMQTWESKYVSQIYGTKFPSKQKGGKWAENRKKHYGL